MHTLSITLSFRGGTNASPIALPVSYSVILHLVLQSIVDFGLLTLASWQQPLSIKLQHCHVLLETQKSMPLFMERINKPKNHFKTSQIRLIILQSYRFTSQHLHPAILVAI